MRRREFVTLLGGAATAWPLAGRAQQPAMSFVGFLNGASAWEYRHLVDAFRRGLTEIGYIEGQNVSIEYNWAEGHYERLPTFTADLVRRRVAVIVAQGNAAAFAAKAATTSIPIVFGTGGDPVALGLVISLNRPGGNLTGVTNLNAEVLPKRVELLRELVPSMTAIGVLLNPTNPNAEPELRDLQAAGRTLGLLIHVLHASTERDFDTVFASLAQLQAAALVIGADQFFNNRIEQLASLALRQSVPVVYQTRQFAASGGLMSYGSDLADGYRLAGIYTGRILKGEKPAELPVQRSTKVELIINLKTAKVLGLDVPPTLLARADEVIE